MELPVTAREDAAWRWVILVFAFAQVFAAFFTNITGIGTQIGSPRNGATPLIQPAGWAFSIWTLIFIGCAAYGVYQFLPGRRDDPFLRSIGWWAGAALVSNTVWSFAAQLSNSVLTPRLMQWLTVVIIVVTLTALIGAFTRMARWPAPLSGGRRWLVVMPLSVFAGWITVATVVDTSAALLFSGFRDVLISEVAWAVLIVVVAGLIGAWRVWSVRGGRTGADVFYGLTLVWAFSWIIVANVPHAAIAAAAGVMTALLVATVVWSARADLHAPRLSHI